MKRRYCVTKISQREKQHFLQVAGFHSFRFFFLEVSGESILRALEVRGTHCSVQLEPVTLSQMKEFSRSYPDPILFLQSPEGASPSSLRTFNENATLWEEICPFPFSLFARYFNSAEGGVHISPDPIRQAFSQLFSALQCLETKMAETELSILWFHSPEQEIAFLCHYVRKRRLGVGTSAELLQIAKDFSEGGLTKNKLFEMFGTQTSFFNVDLSENTAENPILRISAALEKATQEPFQVLVSHLQTELFESDASI